MILSVSLRLCQRQRVSGRERFLVAGNEFNLRPPKHATVIDNALSLHVVFRYYANYTIQPLMSEINTLSLNKTS